MDLRHLLPVALTVAGCAHVPLSGAEVDRMNRPAFISRIEEAAGPRSTVFRDDYASYKAKLKKLDAKEADRRLAAKLAGTKDAASITRFEVADTLRAETLARLPQERPWTRVVNPADVARLLESFLVEEVPANPPDYDRLREVDADTVVEFVVEDFGMRSENGRAGVFLYGHARAFPIGGGTMYFRRFYSDEVKVGLEGLDPFAVAKNPGIFRDRLRQMLRSIADVLAKDLNPPDRRGGAAKDAPSGTDDVTPAKIKRESDATEDPL